ncbi:MAG: glycosyltransferase, partial [Raoultibacter sp.]
MVIVLSGGGTAGHINPALALAEVLEQRGHTVLFAGTPQGVEARLVREAGIPFTPFEATGFNRNHPTSIVRAVAKILKSTRAAKAWFEDVKPDVVVGFGGYVSIPVGRAAEAMGIPVVVHEQNSVMGMANKYLA